MLVRAGQATQSVIVATVSAPEQDSVVDYAQRCLRASGYFGLRSLSCEHHEGVLVLRGQVSSWYQKQLVQEAVRHLPGVEAIINVVDVVAPNESERWSSKVTNVSDWKAISPANARMRNMLILSRKRGERIVIGPDIELIVVAIRGKRVQLGFHASKEVAIHREEILGQSCPGRQSGDTNGRATKSP